MSSDLFSIISIIAGILLVIMLVGYRIVRKTEPESSWLLRSFPYWLGGYCVALCLMIPEAFFSPYGIWGSICIYSLFAIQSVCALMLVVCFIGFILQKQWGNVGRMIGLALLLLMCSFIVLLFAGMGAGCADHFGRRHPIPADLSYYEPGRGYDYNLDSRSNAEELARERQIYITGDWNGYEYAILVPALDEEGTLKLRAYEAVTNDPLTLHFFKPNSLRPYRGYLEARVCDHDSVYVCDDRVRFDEGIPEEPYAARIELWFVPKNEAHKERMLSSAIYKVEAWAR